MSPASGLREAVACSCFAVRRAARAITQHYDRHLKPAGLRATQFTALTVLSLAGPLPLSQLAEQLGTERTTLTRSLRLLKARGWVRELPTDDRRVRMLEVTGRGAAAAHAAHSYWRRAQKSIADHLGPAATRALHLAAEAATGTSAATSPRTTGR